MVIFADNFYDLQKILIDFYVDLKLYVSFENMYHLEYNTLCEKMVYFNLKFKCILEV